MKTGVIAILGFLFSLSLQAEEFSSECKTFAPPLKGGYCVHVPNANKSKDFAYHFHGMGGSEESWQNGWYYTEQIRREWKNSGAMIPTVISVSFGPLWALAEKNQSPASGLFEVFTQQVLPAIEAQLGGLRGRRVLFGESMGGFNAIQMGFKTSLFSKVAVLCAPMSETSPFASPQELEDSAKQSAAWNYYQQTSNPNMVIEKFKLAAQLARGFYPTPTDWDAGNPLALALTKRMISTEFYVAVGFYDVYAAYEGNEKFVSLLNNNGIYPEWRPQWGDHCSFDIPSLAQFLVK